MDLKCSRWLYNRYMRKLPFWSKLLDGANGTLQALSRLLPARATISLLDLHEATFRLADCVGRASRAKPLADFTVSLAGNPEDVFLMDGKTYTSTTLYYYLRYAYNCRFFDFDGRKTIVELGSGSGKQAELVKRLHPDVTYLLLDIPPQLYVCEQYLKTVFPGCVVSYRETRQWTDLTGLRPRHIHILPNWKFPLIASSGVDLFWNAASFQEMEPEVVANYLRFVAASAAAVYLQQIMSGKEVATAPGTVGVKQPTTLRDYAANLGEFRCEDLSPCLVPPLFQGYLGGYSDSFWTRSAPAAGCERQPVV